jgi:hypothetical protein
MASDDPASDLVKAAAEGTAGGAISALIAPVTTFLGKLLGSSVEQLGGWAGDIISFKRWQSRVKMLTKAEQIIEASGLEAHEVPLRVLMPILDGAANEDRTDMQDRWARLLANAATMSSEMPAAFPDVLRQLDPVDARVLDHVYNVMMSIDPEIRRHDLGMIRTGIAEELGLPAETIEFHVDNLVRLRLVREPTGSIGGTGDAVTLSEFGRRFVRASRPPEEPDPPITFTDAAEVRRQAAQNRQHRLPSS